MASQPVSALDVEALERQAELQRLRLGRDVADLRESVREELDVRTRVEQGIHAQPRAFYSAAAGIALFIGYIFARLLKA